MTPPNVAELIHRLESAEALARQHEMQWKASQRQWEFAEARALELGEALRDILESYVPNWRDTTNRWDIGGSLTRARALIAQMEDS